MSSAAQAGPRVVQATVRVAHGGCASQVLAEGTTLTLLGGDADSGLYLLHARAPEALASAMAQWQARAGEGVHVLSRTATEVVFRSPRRSDLVSAALQASGCARIGPAACEDGAERFTLVAPSRAAVRALMQDLERYGEVELERLSEVAPGALPAAVPLADLASGLTARQLAAFRHARAHGYYDRPKRASSDQLARGFDVAASTFREHLRKAELTLLARVAGLLEADAALAQGATRRPGRPPGEPREPR